MDIQLDQGPVHQQRMMVVSHTAGVSLSAAMGHDLDAARRISITYSGQTWTFEVSETGAAIDAVAKCAGEPTLAERDAAAPKEIAGAGAWMLLDGLPGAPGSCSARVSGAQVDTILLPAKDPAFVLVAGRPDWTSWGAQADALLAIDGAPAERVKANSLNNLVLVLIDDPALAQRLRKARTLDWVLPNGRFHAEVKGLGAALDAALACRARRAGAKP